MSSNNQCRFKHISGHIKTGRVKGFGKIRGPLWGPHDKDYNVLGSILGPSFLDTLIKPSYDFERTEYSLGINDQGFRIWK